ncbi:MAG: tRNA pseudouridine(38-40) synthase TruA [Thermodesulfovibrionales bacterium]|nr:tRNA pseudouridine(38-40) synthase TruA [Thermodesulfovibrionales bacterium]
MRNIKLTLEYDGTGYSGWQAQGRGGRSPTIQETVEERIYKLTGARPRLSAAGRTDAGVHALGQVAAFKTESGLDTAVIKKALNAMLPSDIRVIETSEAEDSFHPRYSAASKRYVYLILRGNAASLPVFLRRFVWAVPYKLNIEEMAKAAVFFKGRQDFSAMRGSGCGAKSALREVTDFNPSLTDEVCFLSWKFKGEFIKIDVTANAFLRHMVRNMTGTLVEVGRGKMEAGALPRIMASGDRRLAGPTAPATGLFLQKVNYP